MAAAIAAGKLDIDSAGHVRLPALQAMDIEPEAIRSRDATHVCGRNLHACS
jgi:hypothetical protein